MDTEVSLTGDTAVQLDAQTYHGEIYREHMPGEDEATRLARGYSSRQVREVGSPLVACDARKNALNGLSD